MLIDAIIPTFNREATLRRSIESVLKQSYQNFILHIVDDGSTDSTSSLLKEYQSHTQIKCYFQKNSGVSAARNLAVRNSYADWITFLDSDDEWLPHKLEEQFNFLSKNPTCSFLHSEEIWIRNGVRVNPKEKHKKSNDNIFLRSLDFCLISPSTVLMKRELFLKHHGFDERFTVCEDYDLWLKILANESIGFIGAPLIYKYGGHNDQLSTKFVAMDYWRIKSLVSLYKSLNVSEVQKEQIKKVLIKKSEILLKAYLKYQNHTDFNEISNELSSIMLSIKT